MKVSKSICKHTDSQHQIERCGTIVRWPAEQLYLNLVTAITLIYYHTPAIYQQMQFKFLLIASRDLFNLLEKKCVLLLILFIQCGTKPDMNGKFYENNIVVQYDKDLIEVWDEAKRLRCEWYNDYEKGITKPPIRVSDLEVVELNFRGEIIKIVSLKNAEKNPSSVGQLVYLVLTSYFVIVRKVVAGRPC